MTASLCRRLLIVGPIWLLPAISTAQIVPGDYGDTVVGFDPARGVVTGYHEAFRTGNGTGASPQFTCSFTFVGEYVGRSRAGERFRFVASSEPSALSEGESEATGHVVTRWGQIDFDFEREELPGCWNVWNYAGGITSSLRRSEPWQGVVFTRTESGLREAPDLSLPATSRVERDQLLYVVEHEDCWLQVDYRSPRNPSPPWALLGDTEPAVRGWIPAETVAPRIADSCQSPPGRTVPGRPYILSVGEMKVRELRSDIGGPDYFVRVERHVPAIRRVIGRLGEEATALGREETEVQSEITALREREAASKVVPGDPLNEGQLTRLAELREEMQGKCSTFYSQSACGSCGQFDERAPCPQCTKCREVEYLAKRKAESEIVPGPPLTEAEVARLTGLMGKKKDLREKKAGKQREMARLEALILARTGAIETSSLVMNFGDRGIITVYEGDELEVEVWDDDFLFDDLIGRTTVILNRAALEQTSPLRVRLHGVEYLELMFRPGSPPSRG